jgi:hypothetical protein
MSKPRKDDQRREAPATGDLLHDAAVALALWAKAGFAVVDEPTYLCRIAACQACPDFVQPPETLLYRMAGAPPGERRICRHCGCLVAQKARLQSERCPAGRWA